jgi:hypothetical protein
MRRVRLAVVLWLLFVFVTWNVVFDRAVADAGLQFTRDQILSYQQGASFDSIAAGFSPHVGRAALKASFYAGIVLACGGLVLRRART